MYFNTERAPWDNVYLRQAVCYALDRDYIVEAAASGFGQVTGRMNIPNVTDSPTDTFEYTYDLEKAKELVAQSGLSTPIDGGSMFGPGGVYKSIATVIQQMLADIGIEIEVVVPEGNAFVADSQKGDFYTGNVGLSMDGHLNGHRNLLHSEAIGSYNFARYRNPVTDAMFTEVLSKTTSEERQAMYKELFNMVQEDAPYCPLYIPSSLFVYSSGLNVPIIGNDIILFKDITSK